MAARSKDSLYRHYDSSAINLIAHSPKVLEILQGLVPVPAVVEVMPTNFCNFKCPHCRFRGLHGQVTEHLDLDLLDGLLADLSAAGVRALELSGGGEPLAHPQIGALFEIVEKHDFRVGLITNGYAFVDNPALRERALRVCNWIRVSVDGFGETTYRKVHGKRELRYADLRDAITALTTAPGPRPRIGVKMLVSRLNAHELEGEGRPVAIEQALAMGADYLQLKFLAQPQGLAPSEPDTARLAGNIRKHMRPLARRLTIELVPPFSGAPSNRECLTTFLHPVIAWDGTIYICPFFERRRDSHAIGNIRDGGFFRHWGAERHKAAFEAIDHCQCVPKCPAQRYQPVIEFIARDFYRFDFV